MSGALITDDAGTLLWEAYHFIGDHITKNVAEWEALLLGLRALATWPPNPLHDAP